MNNIETGNIILSSLITSHEYANINIDTLMASGLSKSWFVTDIQKDIFEVINVCYRANKPFDENIVAQYLSKEISNPENIILDLLSIKSHSQSIVLEHIQNLREDFRKRMLFELNGEMLKMLNDPKCDNDAVTILMQNTLNDYEFLNNKGYTKKLTDVRSERKTKPERERIPTHIPFIDTVFTDRKGRKGIKKGTLGFISGLKESGKTFTLTRMIENISKDRPVLFGSLEFGKEDYDENIEDQQEQNFFDGNTDNIFIFDDVYDINKVVAEIRFQHKVNKIEAAFLDSMLRLTNNDPNHATNEKKLSDIFSKLGKLCKELDIPIIIIVQSSKEDLKSSIVSVKGCMDADHEAYWWYHIFKTHKNEPTNEQRTVIWVKNKDTKKHPKQYLMFVPQTSDFYRIEIDKHGNPCGAIDNYRKPKYNPAEPNYSSTPQITVYEAAGTTGPKSIKKDEEESLIVDMPEIEF